MFLLPAIRGEVPQGSAGGTRSAHPKDSHPRRPGRPAHPVLSTVAFLPARVEVSHAFRRRYSLPERLGHQAPGCIRPALGRRSPRRLPHAPRHRAIAGASPAVTVKGASFSAASGDLCRTVLQTVSPCRAGECPSSRLGLTGRLLFERGHHRTVHGLDEDHFSCLDTLASSSWSSF